MKMKEVLSFPLTNGLQFGKMRENYDLSNMTQCTTNIDTTSRKMSVAGVLNISATVIETALEFVMAIFADRHDKYYLVNIFPSVSRFI